MQRRNLLKAAGATSALTIGSGVVTAQDDDDNGDDDRDDDNGDDRDDDGDDDGQAQRECQQQHCIHPTLGYAGLSPEETLPSPLQPDHEVDLVTRPPADDEDRDIPEFFFEPTGLHVSPGDVVRFNLATPDHTVTAYHPEFGRQRRVPEQVPPFSSPVLAGGTFWLYRFDQPGVYDLLCAPHELFGMVMRIVAGEPASDWMQSDGDDDADDTGGDDGGDDDEMAGEDDGDDDSDGGGQSGPPLRPPVLTAALVYRDSALAPGNIADAGQVSWEDLADESKRVLVEFPQPEE